MSMAFAIFVVASTTAFAGAADEQLLVAAKIGDLIAVEAALEAGQTLMP